jgi:hypothetical protein
MGNSASGTNSKNSSEMHEKQNGDDQDEAERGGV